MITNDHVAKNTRKDYHLQPKMSLTIVLLVANDKFSSNEHETNVITYALNIHNMKQTWYTTSSCKCFLQTYHYINIIQAFDFWINKKMTLQPLICIFGLGWNHFFVEYLMNFWF